MDVKEIGDCFLNTIYTGNNFVYENEFGRIEICYLYKQDKSLTIYDVTCLSPNEIVNRDLVLEVVPKGIFTKMIKYILLRLNNPKFQVFLMTIMDPEWFSKLRERGWKHIYKNNESLNFYDCDNTSLYMNLKACLKKN